MRGKPLPARQGWRRGESDRRQRRDELRRDDGEGACEGSCRDGGGQSSAIGAAGGARLSNESLNYCIYIHLRCVHEYPALNGPNAKIEQYRGPNKDLEFPARELPTSYERALFAPVLRWLLRTNSFVDHMGTHSLIMHVCHLVCLPLERTRGGRRSVR